MGFGSGAVAGPDCHEDCPHALVVDRKISPADASVLAFTLVSLRTWDAGACRPVAWSKGGAWIDASVQSDEGSSRRRPAHRRPSGRGGNWRRSKPDRRSCSRGRWATPRLEFGRHAAGWLEGRRVPPGEGPAWAFCFFCRMWTNIRQTHRLVQLSSIDLPLRSTKRNGACRGAFPRDTRLHRWF